MLAIPQKLLPQQLALLQLFSFSMTEKEIEDLKAVLVTFYHQKLQDALDKICDEKGITDEILHEEGQKHRRTPYHNIS